LKLKDHDLRQLDADRLQQLGMENPEALVHLSVNLLEDLKAAREQLNQNPNNSSRPPSSRAPWFRNPCDDDADPDEEIELDISAQSTPSKREESSEDDARSSESKQSKKSSSQSKDPSRSPGKQKGAKGMGRTQRLAIDHVVHHRPESCDLCMAELPHEGAVCYTAFQAVDVVLGTEAKMGLGVETTEHR
jgi:transposase